VSDYLVIPNFQMTNQGKNSRVNDGRLKMIWTAAAVSADNKLCDWSDNGRMVQSQ
jgi:hypothetical protein